MKIGQNLTVFAFGEDEGDDVLLVDDNGEKYTLSRPRILILNGGEIVRQDDTGTRYKLEMPPAEEDEGDDEPLVHLDLRQVLDDVTASLETCLANYGDRMPPHDLRQRNALVHDAKAALVVLHAGDG